MIFFVINYNLVKKKSNILALKNKHFPMIISYIELFILWKLILSQNGRGHLNLLIPMIKSKVSFGIGQKRLKKKKEEEELGIEKYAPSHNNPPIQRYFTQSTPSS